MCMIETFFGIVFIILFNSSMLDISKYSSVLGKCCPISPILRAPQSASIIACVKTSPSECASDLNLQSILCPPKIKPSPLTIVWKSIPIP